MGLNFLKGTFRISKEKGKRCHVVQLHSFIVPMDSVVVWQILLVFGSMKIIPINTTLIVLDCRKFLHQDHNFRNITQFFKKKFAIIKHLLTPVCVDQTKEKCSFDINPLKMPIICLQRVIHAHKCYKIYGTIQLFRLSVVNTQLRRETGSGSGIPRGQGGPALGSEQSVTILCICYGEDWLPFALI